MTLRSARLCVDPFHDSIASDRAELRIRVSCLEMQVAARGLTIREQKQRIAEKTDAHDKDGRALLAMHKLVYNTCEICTSIINDIGQGGMKCQKCGTVAGKAGLILQVARLNRALAEAMDSLGDTHPGTKLRIAAILRGDL